MWHDAQLKARFSQRFSILLLQTDFAPPYDEFCESSPTPAPSATIGSPTAAPVALADLCSCSPTVFSFRFNFDGECPGNIKDGNGIESVGCVADNDFGGEVKDMMPRLVTKITITEFGQDGSIIMEDEMSEQFLNGDVFDYTSIAATGILPNSEVPVTLQITLSGQNEIGVSLFNTVAFRYTNECDEYVSFEPDAAVGWLLIVSVRKAVATHAVGFLSLTNTDIVNCFILVYRRAQPMHWMAIVKRKLKCQLWLP